MFVGWSSNDNVNFSVFMVLLWSAWFVWYCSDSHCSLMVPSKGAEGASCHVSECLSVGEAAGLPEQRGFSSQPAYFSHVCQPWSFLVGERSLKFMETEGLYPPLPIGSRECRRSRPCYDWLPSLCLFLGRRQESQVCGHKGASLSGPLVVHVHGKYYIKIVNISIFQYL